MHRNHQPYWWNGHWNNRNLMTPRERELHNDGCILGIIGFVLGIIAACVVFWLVAN